MNVRETPPRRHLSSERLGVREQPHKMQEPPAKCRRQLPSTLAQKDCTDHVSQSIQLTMRRSTKWALRPATTPKRIVQNLLRANAEPPHSPPKSKTQALNPLMEQGRATDECE